MAFIKNAMTHSNTVQLNFFNDDDRSGWLLITKGGMTSPPHSIRDKSLKLEGKYRRDGDQSVYGCGVI